MTSLISAALGARVHFPQALACHMSTCLPAHVTVPAASSRWRGVGGAGGAPASQPCSPLTFSSEFAEILSLLTGFLPQLFSSLQTHGWDLTRPSICLRRLYNLFSLRRKFNLPSGLPGAGWARWPSVLSSKGHGAQHLCQLSFSVRMYPNLWRGDPYCGFLDGVW